MGIVTPIIDSLRPLVLGRAVDLSRLSHRFVNAPLSGVPAKRGVAPDPAEQGSTKAADRSEQTRVEQTRKGSAAPHARGSDGYTAEQARNARGAAGVDLSISRAARFLAEAFTANVPASAVSASRAQPLIASATPPNTTALAGLLEHQVTSSGLFYEAHLLQWLRGRRSLERLAREPQARLALEARHGSGNAKAGPARPKTLFAAMDSHSRPHANEVGAGQSRLVQLASQQIETLQSGVFRWHGYAAAEIPLHWEIREHEDKPRRPRAAFDDTRFFSSELRLDLPKLGVLQVRLTLGEKHIDIQASTERASSTARLEQGRDDLRERLGGCGFATVDIDVAATNDR